MSTIKLNLGNWSSVFAVPSSVVDKHIKLASEAQLKVLLCILRDGEKENTFESIAKRLSIAESEVENAVDFWCRRGLLARFDSVLSPADATAESKGEVVLTVDEQSEKSRKPSAVSRPQRPDSAYVAKLLLEDSNLASLLEEAQMAFAKPLSPGDAAILVMLYTSYGLPCEVIAMLIHYCVSVGKSNIHAVEKLGISWSDNGISTVQDAENEIERLSSSNNAWKKVSALFGIKNIGNPTKAQLEHADRWLNTWHFSDEMLEAAYERCVDNKGEFSIRYTNGILAKWYEKNIFSLDSLRAQESKTNGKRKKASSDSNASYDLASYENQSLFDD